MREIKMMPLDAEFVVQEQQRPEVAARQHYILLLVHVPYFDREERVTSGVPLYVVITENDVWTLHYEPLDVLDDLREEFEAEPEKLEEYFDDSPMSLALFIIRRMYNTAFKKLERLGKHIDIAEDAVFHGNERKMVEEVALLARDVMDFRKIIRPQRHLFAHQLDHKFFDTSVKHLWNRMLGQVERLWDTLGSLHESVRELSETNDSLLQHKENELLRFLTMYSILAIPVLVLVDPFFVPSAASATRIDSVVFWVVFSILVVSLIFVLLRFKGKRIL